MQEQRTQLICAKCRGQWLQAYAQGKCGKCNEWTFAVSAKVEPIEPKDESDIVPLHLEIIEEIRKVNESQNPVDKPL